MKKRTANKNCTVKGVFKKFENVFLKLKSMNKMFSNIVIKLHFEFV